MKFLQSISESINEAWTKEQLLKGWENLGWDEDAGYTAEVLDATAKFWLSIIPTFERLGKPSEINPDEFSMTGLSKKGYLIGIDGEVYRGGLTQNLYVLDLTNVDKAQKSTILSDLEQTTPADWGMLIADIDEDEEMITRFSYTISDGSEVKDYAKATKEISRDLRKYI